ncbi:MAG: hypothetical protein ACRDEB_09725 [Chitinophagaceae bacterium]
MKTINVFTFVATASTLLIISCQKNSKENILHLEKEQTTLSARDANPDPSQSSSIPYTVNLENSSQVGSNYEWIWSVTNNNPGNGKKGTFQDLSHWGIKLDEIGCNYSSQIVGAAFSHNGTSWTYFNPAIKTDPSQNCMTEPVLKFDFGTTGSSPSYYKLIVNSENQPSPVQAYYKSGSVTGCGTFSIESIGCGFSR